MIDFHIHILPAIDDGSQNMDDSLEMARQCVDSGVTHIVATPHGSQEKLSEVIAKRNEKIREFREQLQKENIPLIIIPGLEYSADGHSADAALSSPDCRCGESTTANRPMLVELPFTVDMSFAGNLLFKAQLNNLTLILAHPERYTRFTKNIDMLIELMDKGLYLQFNSTNFKGHLFNNAIPKGIMKLIAHAPEQVLVGSDAHHPQYRPAGLQAARDRITRELGDETWTMISTTTPSRLLGL